MGDQEDFRAWFRENEERLEADFRNRGASLFWRQSLVVVSEFGDGNAWHTLRRERVYQSPPVLVHQEDLTLRNTILNLPPGTEIIPSWGIRARSLLLNRCPVCLETGRLSLYVCRQCRQRPACRECTLQLLNGETGCRAPYVASPT